MSFDKDMDIFLRKLDGKLNRIVKGTVSVMSERIVSRTPFGDPSYWKHPPKKGYEPGHARKNWQYSTGAPIEMEIAGVDQSPDGSNTAAKIQSQIPGDAAKRTHYLCNSVPYIWRLENGWSSRQAGPGDMVHSTVSEFQRIVAGVAAIETNVEKDFAG